MEFLAFSSNHILCPIFPSLGEYFHNLVNQSKSAHTPLYSLCLKCIPPMSQQFCKLNIIPNILLQPHWYLPHAFIISHLDYFNISQRSFIPLFSDLFIPSCPKAPWGFLKAKFVIVLFYFSFTLTQFENLESLKGLLTAHSQSAPTGAHIHTQGIVTSSQQVI